MAKETVLIHKVKCIECQLEFDMSFTFEGKELTGLDPSNCPSCDGCVFHSRFQSNPDAWFGTWGSYG